MKTSLESPVPLLDLGAVHGPLAEELIRDFERVLRSGHFILGPEHDAFEKELAAACGVEHAIGIASGTAALSIALLALFHKRQRRNFRRRAPRVRRRRAGAHGPRPRAGRGGHGAAHARDHGRASVRPLL